MIWGYAPTDPSTSWHYAANVVGATAPMWFSAPTMWQQSGPAPADAAAAPPMWHAAAGGPAPMWHQAPAGPPPMWHAAPSFAAPPSMWMQGGGSVSVVHVVHHFAGPAPTPPPAPEQTGEGPRAD